MRIDGAGAIVTGGASGLGAATATMLAKAGARVTIFDRDAERGAATAARIGGRFASVDVTDGAAVGTALAEAATAHGVSRVLVNCAGIGPAQKTVGRENKPHDLALFQKVIAINLVGSFTVLSQFAALLAAAEPLDEERGVIVNTASVAAFDGQVGQVAYAASKGGVVGMTLPVARDLMGDGVRVNTILPGIFETPMMAGMAQNVQDALAASVPFPKRLGRADEYADLALFLLEQGYMNGASVRLDGAIRLAPR